MSTPLYNVTQVIITDYNSANTNSKNAETQFGYAYQKALQGYWNEAIIFLCTGCNALQDAVDNLIGRYSTSSPYSRVPYAFKVNWEYSYSPFLIDNGNGTITDQLTGFTWRTMLSPYGLTYIDICNAWAADSFRGRAETIAYIDRMRQLIWNEPFNVIWAARPEGG